MQAPLLLIYLPGR